MYTRMDTQTNREPNRQAAVNGLAVVGFVALILLGMSLAVYSARFVPEAVSRIGSAAVYLGSVFQSPPAPALSVVPTAPTTIQFGGTTATTTAPVATSTSATPTKPKPVATTAGQETSSVQQIGGGTASPTLYGLPDLAVTIDQIGYLATTSAESFVASSTVPHGSRPAVVFTVKNTGTNISGIWSFSATIPTQTSYVYSSPNQQILRPGESIQFTLGFDQASPGSSKTISIHVSSGTAESNSTYNDASATLTILGS